MSTVLSLFSFLPLYGAILIIAAYYLLSIIAYWKIFTKADQPGWKGIIPLYNRYIIFKISWSPSWFWAYISLQIAFSMTSQATIDSHVFDVLSLVVAAIAIVVKILYNYKLSKAFGHGVIFTILLLLIPNVMTLILAFGKSKYLGPQVKENTNGKKSTLPKIYTICSIAIVIGTTVYQVVNTDDVSNMGAVTDTKPAIYNSNERFSYALSQEDGYYLLSKFYDYSLSEGQTEYVIPGLNNMKTLNLKTQEIDSCQMMTPQALAVTDKYLFITTYCHNKEHNSMILVLDKKTGDFVKEIPIEGNPHAGGLAYDSENDILWISGDTKGKALASAISLEAIESYDSDTMAAPIEYLDTEEIPDLTRNSFMTYSDGILYAGYFDIKDDSIVDQLPVEDDGTLVIEDEDNDGDASSLAAQLFATIGSQTQGMSFMDKYILLVRSYGFWNSQLLVAENTSGIKDGVNDLTGNNILMRFSLPDRLEYAVYYDGEIYLLFESGSNAYRNKSILPIDRVLVIDIYDEDTGELINIY